MWSYFRTPAMPRFISGVLLLSVLSAGRCAEEKVISSAINSFSLDLFKEVARGTTGNMAVSPMTASMVLAMVLQGAMGDTARQLEEVLYMDTFTARRTYGGLTRYYQHYFEDSATTVSIANKIFLHMSHTVNPSYTAITMPHFASDVGRVDFTAEGSRHVINNWVAAATGKKILNFFTRDPDRDTQMILVNALYFRSPWDKPFNRNRTANEMFHLNESDTILVPTMKTYAQVYYGECYDLKAKWIMIPFEDTHFSLLVVLPDEKFGLNRLVNKLTSEAMSHMIDSSSRGFYAVSLPRFALHFSHQLVEPLEMLGVRTVFTGDSDLRGISSRPLRVSQIVQKASFRIDEDGGVPPPAAAATPAPPLDSHRGFFEVDRPFLAAVVDMNKGVPLFLAIVRNPLVRTG